jgi:hypothetical protein
LYRYGEGMMTVDFPQATVDMLPRTDAKWRFKSCAIVGNSGGAVQVEFICPMGSKRLVSKPLNLKCEKLVSKFD